MRKNPKSQRMIKFSMVGASNQVKQAHTNLISVLEDMRNYREILRRLKEDRDMKKGK